MLQAGFETTIPTPRPLGPALSVLMEPKQTKRPQVFRMESQLAG